MGGQDFFAEEIAPQMDYYNEEINKQIPKSENFLQRAIKQTVGKPLFQGSDVPAIGHQFAEGVVGNAPQNIVQNPMMTAMGGPSATQMKSGTQAVSSIKDLIMGGNSNPNENSIVEDNKYLTPQTIGGKVIGLGANILGGAVNPATIALGGKAINSLKTGPIKKEIKGIEDLISGINFEESNVKSEIDAVNQALSESKVAGSQRAKETAYTGAKEIKKQVSGRFRDANQRFGEEFSKLDSTMSKEDLSRIINRAANDIGAADIPGSPGNNLLSKIKKYNPDNITGSIQTQGIEYLPQEVQQITKDILDSLPDDRSKAIFHKYLLEGISESIPGLKELKESHAPIYQVAKESKFLKESNLNQIASGKAPTSKVDDLSRMGERLGTSHVERAKKVAEKNKLEQMMIEQKKTKVSKRLDATKQERDYQNLKLSRKKDDLTKTTGRKNWAIGAGTAGFGLPILGSIWKRFFGDSGND